MLKSIDTEFIQNVLHPWINSCGGLLQTLSYSEVKNENLSLIPGSTILIGTFLKLSDEKEGTKGFYCEILSHNLVFQQLINYKHYENKDELIKISLSYKRKLFDIIKVVHNYADDPSL